MSKPVLAAGLLAAAAGAWFWALLPPQASATSGAGAAAAREVSSPVPHLRLDRLDQPRRPLAAATARDPFRTGVAAPQSRAASTRPVAAPAVAPAADAAASPAVWPRLELIGVAETREGADLVRVAIVSGPRGVHHVQSGELVEQVYRVERIDAGGIELRLLPEDRPVRLVLRP